VLVGQRQQSAQERIHPRLRQLSGQRQGQERSDGLAAHGGYVAETPRQATMSNRFRGMPVAPEVNVFQREVGGDQHFMTGWNPQEAASSPIPSGIRAAPGLPESWRIRRISDFSEAGTTALTIRGGRPLAEFPFFVALRVVGRASKDSRIVNTLVRTPMDSRRLTSTNLLCYGLVVNLL
jgi:hypothetical protein